MTKEDKQTIKAMIKYGGSFVRHLAAAALCADADNLGRIKAAFPELWARYEEFAKLDKEREEKGNE